MTCTSSSINLASDSDDEIQIVTMWDREARKEDMYKIAYSIFLGRKYDSPSLSEMRDWLTVFVTKSPPDFFLNGLKQLENFTLLMQVSRMFNLSKTTVRKRGHWILLPISWQFYSYFASRLWTRGRAGRREAPSVITPRKEQN